MMKLETISTEDSMYILYNECKIMWASEVSIIFYDKNSHAIY